MRRPHCPLTAPTLLEQLFCLPKGARLLLSVPPAGVCIVLWAQRGGNGVLGAMNYQLPTCFCYALNQPCCFRMWELTKRFATVSEQFPFNAVNRKHHPMSRGEIHVAHGSACLCRYPCSGLFLLRMPKQTMRCSLKPGSTPSAANFSRLPGQHLVPHRAACTEQAGRPHAGNSGFKVLSARFES